MPRVMLPAAKRNAKEVAPASSSEETAAEASTSNGTSNGAKPTGKLAADAKLLKELMTKYSIGRLSDWLLDWCH